jgi:acyl-coenzyme A thioesterase 9
MKVAINKDTLKGMAVAPLILDTDESQRLFSIGAERKARKTVAQELSLQKKPPTIEEMYAIHDIYIESQKWQNSQITPENAVWMHDTVHESLMYTHLQERNLYGKIFGGFLMRIAFELAYVTGLMFCKGNIRFVALDDITFRAPVPVGSIFSLKSRVVYTSENNAMQIEIIADVIDHETGTSRTTNSFYFTYLTEKYIRVLPRTYEESVAYIEGRRRYRKY